MGHPVGRNDPCPCGSGKKFKRCCGASSEGEVLFRAAPRGEPVAGWARAHAVWPKMRDALLAHGMDWLGKDRFAEAFLEFPFDKREDDEQPTWLDLGLSWQLFDWVPDEEEETVAEHWISVAALDAGRNPDIARMVESANARPLSFYQVQALDPGRGAVLKNLLTEEEGLVVDRSMSMSAPPWSVLFARLLDFGGITIFDAVGHRLLPPDMAEEVITVVEGELEQTLPVTPAVLHGIGTELAHIYADLVEEEDERRSRIPTLLNTDSEPLLLCKETWQIEDGKQEVVEKRLRTLGLEPDTGDGTTRFRWVRENEKDPLPSTLLGTVTIEGGELRLEVNSRERRDRFKGEIEGALGNLVTHAGSEEKAPQDLIGQGAIPARDEDSPVPPEVARQMIGEFLERHYATWPDVGLPALQGRTPREAVGTTEGRTLVEALLRDMEHRSHGTPMGEAYDFGNLRRELGLL